MTSAGKASTPRLPEILAPVGDMEMCRAAVHSGADAIYVGMPGFNARGRAVTLSIEELSEIIDFCHLHGVKVFLAFNVLIFERELSEVIPLIRDVVALSPDAFIVQDVGLIRLLKTMAPGVHVHASTQMTVTSTEAIECLSDLGISRYVLGREVSLAEMAKIRATNSAELEVFVHGALCVSYSGQCLTSESMGGRSANRGQCAQSCRLPYRLIVDGAPRDLGERKYLVSPKDLCGLDDVPRLMELGVESFKIEGRLKSPEYVASTVRSYKERSMGSLSDEDVAKRSADLATIYSRGFFNGWFDGVNHQQLVDARYSNNHGLAIGVVAQTVGRSVLIKTDRHLAPGDGVVFTAFSSGVELGSDIYEVSPHPSGGTIVSLRNDFPYREVRPGMEVFLNSSPTIQKEYRRIFSDRANFRRAPITAKVSGRLGRPLTVELQDDRGNQASVSSEGDLVRATSSPLTKGKILEELGALSGTPFKLTTCEFDLDGEVFIHNKDLRELRRRAVQRLLDTQTPSPVSVISEDAAIAWVREQHPGPSVPVGSISSSLNVLIREPEQISALAGSSVDTIYLDFEYGKEYGPSSEIVRKMGFKVGIATTRILKAGELGHLKQIVRIKPDVILVRNLGALHYLKESEATLVGDFSLNIANSLTANYFLKKGIQRVTPSYDLNREQLLDLIRVTGGESCEVTVHQYMPSFHMEHCVFAAFLSNGTSYRDCGRPCEKHRVAIQDPNGKVHPLKADAECRNTMFNGTAQSALRLVPELQGLGVRSFRIEALYESPAELRVKIDHYVEVLKGRVPLAHSLSTLGVIEQYGISEGQLFNIRSYKDRKKESHPRP